MTLRERTRNIEWRERTDGSLTFVADVNLPDMLVAKVLRSPHPHAQILSIDARRARQAPGVAAVLTSADFADRMYPHEGVFADRYPLARDRVRFVGQEIAAVAAETTAQAEAAVRLIDVRYRRLPAVTTVDQALADGAPRIHDRKSGTNVSLTMNREIGDEAAARAASAVTVSGKFRFNRQTHVAMETSSTVARWNPGTEKLEIWTSTQSPRLVRREIAAVLGLGVDQVVMREVAVGGGFGAKSKITDHEVLAGALSISTGRPVRLVLERAEEFATTKTRHDFVTGLEVGAAADGELTFRKGDFVVDNGAYNHSGASVTGAALGSFVSLYRTRAVTARARLVDTNKHPGGQFRGYGGPQVTLPIESLMDELADRLGMDPIDLRLRNAPQDGDVSHAGYRLTTGGGMAECLRKARELTDWDVKRQDGGSGRGIGISIAMHVSGARTYPDGNIAECDVLVRSDGAVEVRFGGSDAGTGQKHLLAEIVSAETGIPTDIMTVVMMDTEKTPHDLGAFSSRGTTMAATGARAAGISTATRLREYAAVKLGVEADEVELTGGTARVRGDETSSIPVGDLLAGQGLPDDVLHIHESVTIDVEQVNVQTGVADISTTYAFAAHVCEVEIDQHTGQVRVVRYTAVHDSGEVLNPTGFEGQVVGGVMMGLGAALSEELVYEGGQLVNGTYLHYGLQRAADAPEVRAVQVGRPDPGGPYGAKSVGEIGIDPVPAAVANAVAHALGTRLTELPLTPDKVLPVLRPLRPRSTYRLWARPSRWWISTMRWAYPRGLHTVLHRLGTRFARTEPPVVPAEVLRPADLDGVSRAISEPGAVLLGGGTDLLPLADQGLRRPPVYVDLTRVAGLGRIEQAGSVLRIGSAVTLADLARSEMAAAVHPVLGEVIDTIASQQIREMATVAGNLVQEKRCWFYRNDFNCYKRGGATCPCYAVEGDSRYYHAIVDAHRCQAVTPSDLAPVLVALDAYVVVRRDGREHRLAMKDLYNGPGETVLGDRDVIIALEVPTDGAWTTTFEKLQLWSGDFAVASATVSLRRQDDAILDARVVLGGISAVPFRAHEVEDALRGARFDDSGATRAAEAWIRHAHPLHRNEWKVEAATGVLAKAIGRHH